MHRIVKGRLEQAVIRINKKYRIPREHRLRMGPAFEIMERFIHLRNEGAAWHSAQQGATRAQKGVGPSRETLYRRVIGLYGWWTRKAMKKKGLVTPPEFLGGGHKIGGTIVRTMNKRTGQMRFIA